MNDTTGTPREDAQDGASNDEGSAGGWAATVRSWPTWVKVVGGVAAGVVTLSALGAVAGGEPEDATTAAVTERSTMSTTERATTTTARRAPTTAPSTTTTVPPTTAPPAPPPTAPPTTAARVIPVVPVPSPAPPPPAPEPPPAPSPSGAFANCAAARAAGAAPVYRGDPGYGPHLDRDDDGVGCE
jgi:hypothetical protein